MASSPTAGSPRRRERRLRRSSAAQTAAPGSARALEARRCRRSTASSLTCAARRVASASGSGRRRGRHPAERLGLPRSSRLAQMLDHLVVVHAHPAARRDREALARAGRPRLPSRRRRGGERAHVAAGHRAVEGAQVVLGHQLLDLPARIGERVAQPDRRGVGGRRGPAPREAGGSSYCSWLKKSGWQIASKSAREPLSDGVEGAAGDRGGFAGEPRGTKVVEDMRGTVGALASARA